ncbi:uncharacterized protein MYCFIDRAFT_179108 [Pseudocercospora fijiensis CIRAD86]|uniref:Uncharacterized protein n=1 Tax=Pseudocercospora fijiensis (strain CIRAD86) TaxID=383855 RepID=M2YII8_PSEFD|nr:uncharacterized protein MYCFIDRAFT_179108 [Pseudocercospora fijiensis CIRAD86]EME77590.1 hypothetical protein MYCFIDRAFT_179108 [Pseudocercospora fijiensis CIRAD86]
MQSQGRDHLHNTFNNSTLQASSAWKNVLRDFEPSRCVLSEYDLADAAYHQGHPYSPRPRPSFVLRPLQLYLINLRKHADAAHEQRAI